MLVATSELEMERMNALWKRIGGKRYRARVVKRRELREREPNITGRRHFVPSSGIVSYREVTAAMAKIFRASHLRRSDAAVMAIDPALRQSITRLLTT